MLTGRNHIVFRVISGQDVLTLMHSVPSKKVMKFLEPPLYPDPWQNWNGFFSSPVSRPPSTRGENSTSPAKVTSCSYWGPMLLQYKGWCAVRWACVCDQVELNSDGLHARMKAFDMVDAKDRFICPSPSVPPVPLRHPGRLSSRRLSSPLLIFLPSSPLLLSLQGQHTRRNRFELLRSSHLFFSLLLH